MYRLVVIQVFVAENVLGVYFDAVKVTDFSVLIEELVEHRLKRLLLQGHFVNHVQVFLGLVARYYVLLVDAVLHFNPQDALATHEVDDDVKPEAPYQDYCQDKSHGQNDIGVVYKHLVFAFSSEIINLLLGPLQSFHGINLVHNVLFVFQVEVYIVHAPDQQREEYSDQSYFDNAA